MSPDEANERLPQGISTSPPIAQWMATTGAALPGEHLFDLDYSELEDSELSKVFSFGGIEDSNTPIGVPFPLAGGLAGEDYLLFDLNEFAAHLQSIEPSTFELFERHHDVDCVLSEPDCDTARVFLVASLLAAIEHCLSSNQILQIRW
jgi:hypothetical protein